MHMKTYSIWVSIVFLISIGLAAHWPLLSPIHTHEASISGNKVSGQAFQGYRHHHRAVLYRDGSLAWYSVYPDTGSAKLQFNEIISFTPFRPLPVLSSGGIQQLEKIGGFAFLGIFTPWNLSPHFPLVRIRELATIHCRLSLLSGSPSPIPFAPLLSRVISSIL